MVLGIVGLVIKNGKGMEKNVSVGVHVCVCGVDTLICHAYLLAYA